MTNPQLEAIVEKLRVLTPEDSELLEAVFGDEHSAYSDNISVLERDCLKEGYFKEYHQLADLTRYSLSRSEIEQIELELLVAGELQRYDDCCRETEVALSTEQIRIQEKEMLRNNLWKEYRRIENHTKVSLSPAELKPFEASLKTNQKELLINGKINEYFERVGETGISLPKSEMKKILGEYLVNGGWGDYLVLSEEANVKLSSSQLNELKANKKVTECQLEDFKNGFSMGDFTRFLKSKKCLGVIPDLSTLQAAQCSYLHLNVSEGTYKSYRSSLNDKAYKASVKAADISVSLEQLELVGRLKDYRSK